MHFLLSQFLSAWTNLNGSVSDISCCGRRCYVSTVRLIVALYGLNGRVVVKTEVGTNAVIRPAQVNFN